VLHLAEQLSVPLRERNQLLLAAGYAPGYSARTLEDPDMGPVRDAIGRVLTGHEPYPAIAIDRHWNLVASNSALGPLLMGASPELLAPPANCMRLALHPDGIAPRIINLGEWRTHLIHRLERQIALSGDDQLRALRDEIETYPGGEDVPDPAPDGSEIMVELRLTFGDGGELAFFSTVTTFGTAFDVTLSELSIEAFFPANEDTAETLQALAAAGVYT
jgi:hypothetical protein